MSVMFHNYKRLQLAILNMKYLLKMFIDHSVSFIVAFAFRWLSHCLWDYKHILLHINFAPRNLLTLDNQGVHLYSTLSQSMLLS